MRKSLIGRKLLFPPRRQILGGSAWRGTQMLGSKPRAHFGEQNWQPGDILQRKTPDAFVPDVMETLIVPLHAVV